MLVSFNPVVFQNNTEIKISIVFLLLKFITKSTLIMGLHKQKILVSVN